MRVRSSQLYCTQMRCLWAATTRCLIIRWHPGIARCTHWSLPTYASLDTLTRPVQASRGTTVTSCCRCQVKSCPKADCKPVAAIYFTRQAWSWPSTIYATASGDSGTSWAFMPQLGAQEKQFRRPNVYRGGRCGLPYISGPFEEDSGSEKPSGADATLSPNRCTPTSLVAALSE